MGYLSSQHARESLSRPQAISLMVLVATAIVVATIELFDLHLGVVSTVAFWLAAVWFVACLLEPLAWIVSVFWRAGERR
jgi:hypothetical protein